MATATRARATIQAHPRLLAASAAEESRSCRLGRSMESRWPIRSLLSVAAHKTDVPSESAGQDWGLPASGAPAEHFEPTGNADLRIDWTDFRSKWLRSSPL